VAFGEACRIAQATPVVRWIQIAKLRDEFEAAILQTISTSYCNGASAPRLPNTANLGFSGIDNDALVTYCDRNNICISSGSACMESAITPSHVILAMQGNATKASESVRVSFQISNSREDAVSLITCIQEFSMLCMD
jgi:cysteine desulfurase